MQTWTLPAVALLSCALALPALAPPALAPPALAKSERRELGAHQHGHGTLNIAIEDGRVAIELEAPGMDIVGFEHEAKSDGDRMALKAAIARLEKPLELFALTDEAGCKVADVDVEHEIEEGHSAFHAKYELECTAIARLKALTLTYFKAFTGAAELEVNVVSAKGQASVEVTRDKPELDLSRLM